MSAPSDTNPFAIALISKEVLLCFFGVYCWEYCVSLWFEWKIVTKEYPFRWPLIPYFLARYFGLASLIANLVFAFPPKELNCQALHKSIIIFGNIGITAASGNLMIRAIIVWDYRRWVVGLLLSILIGQWILVFVDLRVGTVRWSRSIGACVPIDSQARETIFVGAFSIYTAGLDLVVAILTVLGVRKFGPSDSLASLLRRQGVEYFALILLVHTAIVALVFYDTRSFFGIYGALAAVVFSPIMACRLVRAVFNTQPESRRGTSRSTYFSPWDASSSSRSAPQDTDVQLNTQIHPPRPEAEDGELQFPSGKLSRRPASSIGGTLAISV